jgi:hypothetical protein
VVVIDINAIYIVTSPHVVRLLQLVILFVIGVAVLVVLHLEAVIAALIGKD